MKIPGIEARQREPSSMAVMRKENRGKRAAVIFITKSQFQDRS